MRASRVDGILREMGLPTRDAYDLPASEKRFPDGAQYRTEELPTTVAEYERMYTLADKQGYVINRISDVRGTMFDSDDEIVTKLQMAREHGTEVLMGPGPGEHPFDISQQAEIHQIVEGKLRGMDNVRYTLDSMLRASDLGCRGFLMYDEGMLLIALKMRKDGTLARDTKFKISANVSVANAAAVKFWFDLLGPEDEINPVRDLTLPMIAAMRQVTDHPLDIHVFHRTTVARTMEVPEIVRVGSPVYLKNARFGAGVSLEDRVQQCFRAVDAVKKHLPDAKQSVSGARGLAIPAERATPA
jgi:hypothetical protein